MLHDVSAAPPDAGGAQVEIGRAKVNLFLHVTGRRADGYHLLDSLTVFADLGDRIEAEPAAGLSLSLDGPFAAGLPTDGSNLALAAAEALRAHLPPGPDGTRPGAALRLTKSLPAAAGIGGGSADAAAALRALSRLWGLSLPPERLAALALPLGADVPVCLTAAPRRMQGIGEILSPVPALPPFWLLLVNPMQPTPTPAVFRALRRRENPPAPSMPEALPDAAALAAWLGAETRNDLGAPALEVTPAIGEVLAALDAAPGCLLARMSGSGATCFGIFADGAAACAAQAGLPARWWSAAAPAMG